MRRKLAVLLALALSVSLLGGCGKESTATLPDGGSNGRVEEKTNQSDDTLSTGTLSECLSKEKVIAYIIDEFDKAETPSKIYFFEDGKLTIIPGEEFGLTLGDLSKMEDEEIWETYKTVRETYRETWREKTLNSWTLSEFWKKDTEKIFLHWLEEIGIDYDETQVTFWKARQFFSDWTETTYYDGFQMDYNDFQVACSILDAVNGKNIEDVKDIPLADIVGNPLFGGCDISDLYLGNVAEWLIRQYWGFFYCMFYENASSQEFYTVYTEWYKRYENGETVFTGRVMDDTIAFYKNVSGELEQIRDGLSCKGPFYDLPFSFIIETDSTGNNVAKEKLVYPRLRDDSNSEEISTTYNESITFGPYGATSGQIYDTPYNCFSIDSGYYSFCTRASMTIDTVDSENVFIDLTNEEMSDLFKDEVTARYE